MIDTKALRSRVLDLAIQGKLTEQLESDGTAEELWQQIQAEKQRLIKEGKIKREKPLPEISEDEIPFEIPENWKWVRFSSIITLQSGQDLQKDEYNDNHNGIPYMTGASNYNADGSLLINRWTDAPKALAEKGDILLSCKGTVGKIAILSIEKAHIARQIMGIRVYISDNAFISLFVQSKVNGIIAASKGLIPGIERKDVLNMAIPLPPLAEQKRIVARVEEIFRLLDIIDAAQEQYAADAESLKARLFSIAIQGKLTEQLESDGTAAELYASIQAEKEILAQKGELYREKPIKSITPKDIPYDIPSSWMWVRLGDLCKVVTKGSSPKWQGVSYTNADKGIMFVTSENVGHGQMLLSKRKYVQKQFNEMHPSSILRKGDILTNIVGASIGRTAIFDDDAEDANTNQAVCIVRLINQDMSDYILRYLCSKDAISLMLGKVVDTARANLSLTSVSNLMIPLPPLAEQKRIAKMLERLLTILG